MPRIGLPVKPSKTKPSGASSASSSSAALLRVAIGATAFRVISALVAAFCAIVFARGAPVNAAMSFGLYPILTRQVDRIAGQWLASPVTPALVVAWLAFAGAMVMLLRVAELDLDGDRAEGAVLLAVVFPFAFIFGRSDADALFLLFVLGAFWGFRQQKWIVGGVCGALATATIPPGIVILPALAWIGFRHSGAKRLWVTAALLLTAAGFGAYLTYMYYLAGPPGGWADAMSRWGFHLGQAPWLSLQQLLTSHPSPAAAMNGVVTVIALASIPLVWWLLDGGYAIYMLAMLWLPLTSGKYDDLGRICALLFPLFIVLASMRWRIVFMALVIASAMFYALTLAFM
jgi:Gpi18-like mannosyltransferase